MRKVLLAACAVLAMTGSAFGEEPKLYATTAGDWNIFSFKDRCSTSDFFKNGTILQFGIDESLTPWLRVNNPEWKIPAGEYQVAIAFDNGNAAPWAFQADEDGKGIVASYILDETSFGAFTRSSVLNLKIGAKVYSYSLKGTSAMFPKLLDCIANLAISANPFHGQSSAPAAPSEPVSTPSNPFRRT
jgi:hypothetical protein